MTLLGSIAELTEARHERLSYPAGQGVPELLVALADYLNRVRGMAAQPATMVIYNGFTQGFALLLRVLVANGARRLAVEDPPACSWGMRGSLSRAIGEGIRVIADAVRTVPTAGAR